MKQLLRLAALLVLIPGMMHAGTNIVLVANLSLNGFKQAEATAVPVRITTKDLLASLNATGRFHFGPGAQLTLRSSQDQLPTFWVREKTGTNVTNTDISNFLVLSEAVEIHADQNLKSYSLQTFAFDDQNGTSFSVSGVTSLRRTTISAPGIGPLNRVSSAAAQISGSGTVAGSESILRGTVSAGSAKAEVDPD